MGKNKENGKVVQQLVNGTKFDIRMVPKYQIDNKSGAKTWTTHSYALFMGKRNLKAGFKNMKDAADFALENEKNYDTKQRKFK